YDPNAHRNNCDAYAELEGSLIPTLLSNVSALFEHYTDFGNKLTGKLAMRLQPTQRLTLRSAISTGFRAPSLNQSYYSSVVTNFKADPVTGNPVPFEIGIFPVNSREARALGARPLRPESSRNFSAGFAVTPVDNLTFTSDVYYIAIDDRITITGFLGDGTDSVSRILANIGSPATTAQYFTN